jgi:hypothetical protein
MHSTTKNMETTYTPRLTYIDITLSKQSLAVSQELLQKTSRLIEAEPNRMAQTRYGLVADDWTSIGLFAYALGHPLEEVRLSFAHAAEAQVRVFQLRGTETAFPVTVVTKGGNAPDGALHRYGSVDYSVTNSRDGLLAVYLALVGGKPQFAENLAKLLWDPPEATYLGRNSVVCTLNDMYLAYAFKEFLIGTTEQAELYLGSITVRTKEETHVAIQARMVRALIAGAADAFRAGLVELLEWHQRLATSREHRTDPHFFMSLPGLALSIAAVQRRVVARSQLPAEDVFLPHELIDLN